MTGLCLAGDTPSALVPGAHVVLSNVTVVFQNAGVKAAQLSSGPLYLAQTVLAAALVGIELAAAAGRRPAGAGLDSDASAGSGITLLYNVSSRAASEDRLACSISAAVLSRCQAQANLTSVGLPPGLPPVAYFSGNW